MLNCVVASHHSSRGVGSCGAWDWALVPGNAATREGFFMVSSARENTFVVVQLTGGNDALNTVIPHGDGLYYDFRPNISIGQDSVLSIDDNVGFKPEMQAVKRLWDEGKVAVIQGIGYQNPNRSHFRSMDIWHTAEPDAIGSEGWLGRTIRDLDPTGDNVLTGINFGRGLPRALACRGVPVTSVGDLETYGLYPDLDGDPWQKQALDTFSRMYGPEGDRSLIMEFLAQTGGGALRGAEVLRTAPERYESTVETWAHESTTPSTATSTPTRESSPTTPGCGGRSTAPWGTSGTTSNSTAGRTRPS